MCSPLFFRPQNAFLSPLSDFTYKYSSFSIRVLKPLKTALNVKFET